MDSINTKEHELVVGVDVGERSVGLSVVEYPSKEEPPRILAAMSYIHDGGSDPDPHAKESRKAKAGLARRTRRLRRRRHARLKELEHELRLFGCIPPDETDTELHAAWKARALLVQSKIDDEIERNRLLGLAIMHMGRHRGWRNPWSSLELLANTAENGPSAGFVKMYKKAEELFGESVGTSRTLGELVATLVSADPDLWVRPRHISRKRKLREKREGITTKELPKEDKLLFEQIRQEDTYRELRLIAQTQQLSDEFFYRISQLLFKQEPPSVSEDRVGRDDLTGEIRAPIASLAFQEFRIRTTVANLRVHGPEERLAPELYEEIVQYLLSWREGRQPSWQELEEHFGVRFGKTSGGSAPVDMTSITIEQSPIKPLTQWWRNAEPDMRADLVIALSDSVGQDHEVIETLVAHFSDSEIVALEKLKLPAGRAAYGLGSLAIMNEKMRELACDLDTARRKAFLYDYHGNAVDEHWRPSKDSFAVLTGQPAVDRNLAIIHRFLVATTAKWGVPTKVVVEIAREGTLGDQALKALKDEQKQRKTEKDNARSELKKQGVDNPRSKELRKRTLIARQGSQCLYCGTTLSWENTEIDHIVSRATGGSNRVSNLAAVCRACNADKGDKPFALWATTTSRTGVSLEGAIERVRQWNRLPGVLDSNKSAKDLNKEFDNYKEAVIARLKRKSNDAPLDERSLTPTSYAAIAVRDRIEQFLESQPDYDSDDNSLRVQVYRGQITALARIHGGFGRLVMLRGDAKKTRLDRRHHALDAIALTSLRPSVAKVLVERDDLYQSAATTGDVDRSREHYGMSYAEQTIFRQWLAIVESLGSQTKEMIDADQVPVINPIRLRPQIGRVHKDTGEPLIRKPLGSSFTDEEIRRITDRHVYEMLHTELMAEKGHKEILANSDRKVTDESGTLLCGNDLVTLFDGNGGMVRIGNSGFDLGGVHHARIYAWEHKGTIRYGMIRVFGGELGRIGFGKRGVDLFRAELPTWSESWRLADSNVTSAINSGKAECIGWITKGDELDFGPIAELPGNDSHAFFDYYPETRWKIAGILTPTKMGLRPLYLSEEGLTGDPALVVRTVIEGVGWRPVINDVFSVPTLRVIRRTALGRPRWKSATLPASWSPATEAKLRFGEPKNGATRV